MNVMLQRHAAKYIYIVPDGLRELMTDISREVLRSQPENVYLFIADYLEALLITRENARVAARLVQSITEITTTTCEFLKTTGMERADASRIVSVIQKTFKKYAHEQSAIAILEELPEEVEEANIISDIINEANISPDQGEQAATIIQHAYRNFKQRKQKEKELLKGMVDWRVAARSAIRLYRQTGVTNEEANRAATLIKAAYKGYYTRQLVKKLTAENKVKEEMKDLLEHEVDDALGEIAEDDPHEVKMSESRSVKINYDTVIPHVDFGDVAFDESKESPGTPQAEPQITKQESSKSAVVSFALEHILDSTFSAVTDTVNIVASAELRDEVRPLEDYTSLDQEQDETNQEPEDIKENVLRGSGQAVGEKTIAE